MTFDTILEGDVLEVLATLPDESVDCIVTSPPYWGLRDYGVEGQIGLEKTLDDFLVKMLLITAELKRVLKKSGTMFWNHGDSYASIGKLGGDIDLDVGMDIGRGRSRIKKGDYPEKSLLLQSYRLAIRMIDEKGWILRNTVIWHKKNAMPSSVLDRFNNKYEPVFFFTKNQKYYFDLDAVRVPYETQDDDPRPIAQKRVREMGYDSKFVRTFNTKIGTKQREMEETANRFGKRRPPQSGSDYIRNPKGKNPGDVWTLTLEPHKERHIAMFPEKLIRPMILAGCPRGGGCTRSVYGVGDHRGCCAQTRAALSRHRAECRIY